MYQEFPDRSAVFRALLLTSALGVFLKIGDHDTPVIFSTALDWVRHKCRPVVNNWSWTLGAALLVCGLFLPNVITWFRYCLFWFSQRQWTPLVIPVMAIVAVYTDIAWPNNTYAFAAALILLFTALVWYFWPMDHSEESPKDLLHRNYFVKRLTEIFKSKDTKIRRIAVLGTWGAGKTILLKLLERELINSSEAKFRIAFVNPWKARTPEEAWAILAKGFDQALGLPSPLRSNWARYPLLTGVLKLLPLPNVGNDLLEIFAGGSSTSDQRRVENFNRLLAERSIKLILLVDDMERAEPEIIRKMLPVINRLSDLKNCFFVFAIDRDRLEASLGKDEGAGEEVMGYLDKVFDLQLNLPAPLVTDITEMCTADLDANDHPKLSKCFPELTALLPMNPRTARKFLNLAKNKETLFLIRYRDDEHPYLPFFLLWMLESEFPGSIEIILLHEEEFNSITKFDVFASEEPDKTISENFNKIAQKIGDKHHEEKNNRIQALLAAVVNQAISANGGEWLGKRGFQLHWATSGHLRLLELAVNERTTLEKRWKEFAAIESIEEMLKAAIPDNSYSDPRQCAVQLFEMQVEQIEYAIRECSQIKAPELLKEKLAGSLATIESLHRHLTFALKEKLEIERSIFDEMFFVAWLKMIAKAPLERLPPTQVHAIAQLRNARNTFHYELIPLLPVERCYQLYRRGVVGACDVPYASTLQETKDDIIELRKRLLQRVTDHVVKLFRGGNLTDDWDTNRVTERDGIEFLYTPKNWLPVEFANGNLGELETLVAESKSSPDVAKSFALLVEEMFAELLSDASNGDLHQTIMHLSKNNGSQYISLLWKGALSPLVEKDLRERLLQQRRQAFENSRSHNGPLNGQAQRKIFIPDSTIREIFPLDEDEENAE